MFSRQSVKKKLSPLAPLGNVFLAMVLAVSLMPSYSAFGDSGNVGDISVDESIEARAEETIDTQQFGEAADTQIENQANVQAGLAERGTETVLSPGTYSVCANLFVKGGQSYSERHYRVFDGIIDSSDNAVPDKQRHFGGWRR